MTLTKPRRVIDRKYREWIKTKACVLTNPNCTGPIDAAHISPFNGTKGTGSKVSDYRVLPLCRMHHDESGGGRFYANLFERQIVALNDEYFALFPPQVKKERAVSPKHKGIVKRKKAWAIVFKGDIDTGPNFSTVQLYRTREAAESNKAPLQSVVRVEVREVR